MQQQLIINLLIALCFYSNFLKAQVNVDFPEKEEAVTESTVNFAAIDLNGLWESEITQLNWLGQPEFSGTTGKLHVEIKQRGEKVSGLLVCRAKYAANAGYLSYEKKFEGQWKNGKLIYEDVSVHNYINTHQTMRHLETCLKKAELNFYQVNGTYHLEGEWQGNGHRSDVGCVPGKIHLTKVFDEDLTTEVANTVNVNFAQIDNQPVELKWNKKGQIKRLKKRKVKEGKTITVKNTRLSITVYDHKKDDGDIISLYYNGSWLLEKLEIDHTDHIVDVFLEKDTNAPNYLLLYAHNLGEHPPNTVAIIVDDGLRRQRFVLNADMHESDVIYFELKSK